MAATKQTKRPGDFTGRKQQQLEEQRDRELAEKEEQITMANVREQEAADNTAVDLTDPSHPVVISSDDAVRDGANFGDEIEVINDDATVVGESARWIRTNETFNTTIGYGNEYNFVAGQKVKVPANVAAHLEEKGYVWH